MQMTAPLDLSILETLVGSDADVVANVLTVFIDSIESSAQELRAGMDDREANRVQRAAHRIKSPSLAIGAVPLGLLCEKLEVAAAHGEWQQMRALFDDFDSRWRDVRCSAQAIIDATVHDITR